MSQQHGFSQTSGFLRIGQVTSVNTETFRCDIDFPGSYSSAKNVSIFPSTVFGVMPEAGSNVAVYDRPGIGKRVIMVLDSPDPRTEEEILLGERKPGSIPEMEEGDVYIGHRSRAYFSRNGDARIYARGNRASLELKSEKARAELYAYNFDLFTPGKNVRIRSYSTVPTGPLQTWGDALSLEVNVPIAPGLDSAPEVLPTTLGRIDIGKTGSVNIDVLPTLITGSGQVALDMSSVTTEISLHRGWPLKASGLRLGALNEVSLFNTVSSLFMSQLGGIELESLPGKSRLVMAELGDVTLTNTLGILSIGVSGQVDISSPLANLELRPDGSFGIFPNSLSYGLGVSAAGDLTFSGNSASISSLTTSVLSGTAGVSLIGPLISLGLVSGGHVAFAEALVLVLQKLNILHQAIKLHTHSFAGVVVSGAGAGGQVIGGVLLPNGTGSGGTSPSAELAAAGLIPPVPTAATLGSTTVTAQA
jgi:hypothetical protein